MTRGAASGYQVHVFAKIPSTSSNPDSIVQAGNSVFVGTGDDLNPNGTPGPSGKTNVEILQYGLDGTLAKTWSVLGHNDGLMAYDSTTIWAMSNEDCNPKLTVINLTSGSQTVYSPQPSLLTPAGCLTSSNGGLDDMDLIHGVVYTSASNPNPTPPTPCPANISTPGCPNGVSTANAVYILSLNGDGATFNLTPILASGITASNIATGANQILNMTDEDSEGVTPDGSTLLLDSQQDNELVFIKNPGAGEVVSFLPITEGGAPTANGIDDTRYAPSGQTFLLDADTNANYVYRIDSSFTAGNAFSSDSTHVSALNLTTGALTPILSGLQHSNGMWFVVPATSAQSAKLSPAKQ
ncbi:MAG: hypothetical protein ACLPSH_16525 [Vulcanimicrobiaceae bacterium]